MDLVTLIREKRFLGLEFLSWLWFFSEINRGLIELKGLGTVEVWFEDRMVLETGTGNARQTVTCQGKDLDLTEARTALREGKKVSQARLRILIEGREWRFTFHAEGFELSGVRPPKTFEAEEEEPEGEAGLLLDRVALMLELTGVVDALYKKFLADRLTETWVKKTLPRLRAWIDE